MHARVALDWAGAIEKLRGNDASRRRFLLECLAALDADYYKAIKHFEEVARLAVNDNLMKYSVKEYLLKAGICHLATGVSETVMRCCALDH